MKRLCFFKGGWSSQNKTFDDRRGGVSFKNAKGSVRRINGGVVQHCSLTKSGPALSLCIPGMLG